MIILGGQMQEPQAVPLPGGEVVVFSARAPDKDGPNEDGAAVVVAGDGRAVLAVADGMGGGPAGETACRLVLQALEEAVQASGTDDVKLRGSILDALEHANDAIRGLGIGAATTLAAVELTGQTARSYHAGDSGVLVTGQRGRLKHQTVSHSPVGYAVESGLLSADDALDHDELHLVSNMLGMPDMRIEVASPVPLAPRDTLLLATDGLFDNLSVPEIVHEIRKGLLNTAAMALVRGCARRMSGSDEGPSKPDDVAFILYRRGAVA